MTETGASKIEGEIASLKDRLARASDGEDQSSLSRDLRYWETRKASMEIVPLPQDVDHVQFGTTVTIERDGTRQELSIVGEDEADPTSGVIAWTAPLARAVDGANVGDVIAFELPARQEEVSQSGLIWVKLVIRGAARRSWRHLADERIEVIEPVIPLGTRFWPLTERTRVSRCPFRDRPAAVSDHRPESN